MNAWQRNLRALNKINPSLFQKLVKVEPNRHFEVFIGQDSADINFLDKKNNKFLFVNSSIEFVVDKINSFKEFSLYPYLYFFGFGNGVFYKLLLNNASLKRIMIFEPHIEIIFNVLNLLDFSKEIEERRLILFYNQDVAYESLSPFFYINKNALIYSKLYNLHIFNDYYNIYEDEIININKLIIGIIEHGVISIGNDSKDAIIGIKHHIANIPLMLKNPSLYNLVLNAKNTNTAVIVSTGPSLYKQLELLKNVQDYVSIFCVDASFPILVKYGIKPDIVLSMERVELTAKFYEVVEEKYFKDVIFEITSIAHKKLLDEIVKKGGILQLSERPFGYTNYFDLAEYGYIGIGMSAANMAYELVVHCGFSRCIFIGQDLAFSKDGASHSKDAVYGEREIETSSNKIFIEKYGGNGLVETTQVWKLFLNFFTKDIYETKDRIEVINATEGGARIPHTIELSFKESLKKIDYSTTKNKIFLTNPTYKKYNENLKKAKAKVKEYIKYGNAKKEKIQNLFLEVVEQTELLELLNKENRLEEYDFNSLDKLFDRIEGVKKLFSNKKFLNMFNEATQAIIFHQEMELAKISTKITSNQIELNAKKLEWLFLHKNWLFILAGCLDSVLFCVNDSFSSWEV
ncbi:6-hydroxymethylpterin diphosphokinase MptE-like protein [Helicobacter sp. MIT 14-3879]|uniref:motility associated factor glycosyltransferase family protein n=1 Tax=Helicobacter sp. MIT 14-3879 TaxID=2040649 RepID=UPI000E1E4F03|nr:6-hydroxymethylpterin diphosphokinase MptE-like protein [Helicobacter sp. MIT 14-3879]RDU65561.1 motility accessory factor [Helicobacter sp. MIT 14-3879]